MHDKITPSERAYLNHQFVGFIPRHRHVHPADNSAYVSKETQDPFKLSLHEKRVPELDDYTMKDNKKDFINKIESTKQSLDEFSYNGR